jgi:N-acetylmuramoyl-L-alanine amidase
MSGYPWNWKTRGVESVSRLLASLFMLSCCGSVIAGQLEGVRMHEAPDYTRVVFDTAGPVTYELFPLTNPNRVVIDLKNTTARASFDPTLVAMNRKRIKNMRAAPRGADYRVVLDVTTVVKPKGFTLQPVPPYGHRLVVDLYGPERKSGPVAVPKQDGKRDVIIAIDAGHGGEDPGAIGPGRIREKAVVFKIAQRLASKLNGADGYRAVMVRTGDYYVSLRKRVDIARQARADLFVSIHADAFKSPEVSGASVYTLSAKGATSETARWLAEKENRSDLIGGVGDVSLDDKDDLLAHVLLDLSMDATRSASIQAGESVLGQLSAVARMHKRRVEQAGFVVLKAPDVPSFLVETGYISNPAEARRLNSSAYQQKLATAMYEGIRNYMARTAPPGTLVAWRRGHGEVRYTIERGDTLSGIAVRYGTSARRIKEANGISSDSIRVGQVILIPAS